MEREQTIRPQKDCIPHKATWVKDAAAAFHPERNALQTTTGELLYNYLVVCPGIRLRFDLIKGLQESVGKNGVSSNYSYDSVQSTRDFMEATTTGHHVFTAPKCTVKCGGGPLKAAFLVDDFNRLRGTRDQQSYAFYTGLQACFGVPYYRTHLQELLQSRGIEEKIDHNLVEALAVAVLPVLPMPLVLPVLLVLLVPLACQQEL